MSNQNRYKSITTGDLKKLPRSFYKRPTLTVARELLGKWLIRELGPTRLVGKIVETEAYLGKLDPASHTFRGRTKRNDVMYWGGGYLYVYFTYGMHFCANVVTGEVGSGEAVLIRAVEPVSGIEMMTKHRGRRKRLSTQTEIHDLTNGPAKLCEAFSIRRGENGTDLLDDMIYLADAPPPAKGQIGRSRRIGISNGTEKLWRFTIKDNRCVSR